MTIGYDLNTLKTTSKDVIIIFITEEGMNRIPLEVSKHRRLDASNTRSAIGAGLSLRIRHRKEITRRGRIWKELGHPASITVRNTAG